MVLFWQYRNPLFKSEGGDGGGPVLYGLCVVLHAVCVCVCVCVFVCVCVCCAFYPCTISPFNIPETSACTPEFSRSIFFHDYSS